MGHNCKCVLWDRSETPRRCLDYNKETGEYHHPWCDGKGTRPFKFMLREFPKWEQAMLNDNDNGDLALSTCCIFKNMLVDGGFILEEYTRDEAIKIYCAAFDFVLAEQERRL